MGQYSSNNVSKPLSIKPKASEASRSNKDVNTKQTSTSTVTGSSTIEFYSSTASIMQEKSADKEVAQIVAKLKKKVDYSLVIYGNYDAEPGENFSTKSNWLARSLGYKTYADLALARANEIRKKFIGMGADPSKITIKLGDTKSKTATYSVTATTND